MSTVHAGAPTQVHKHKLPKQFGNVIKMLWKFKLCSFLGASCKRVEVAAPPNEWHSFAAAVVLPKEYRQIEVLSANEWHRDCVRNREVSGDEKKLPAESCLSVPAAVETLSRGTEILHG